MRNFVLDPAALAVESFSVVPVDTPPSGTGETWQTDRGGLSLCDMSCAGTCPAN
jgi:hypothetical protein